MPGSVTLSQPIIVNTPGRPISGREQHAAIVTQLVSGATDPDTGAVVTSERISAVVFPAEGPLFNLRDIEREDLLDRVGSLARAPSWQPRESE